MKFYKVRHFIEGGCSNGFEWFTNEKEANRAVQPATEFEVFEGVVISQQDPESELEVVEIENTKAGILLALNWHANHPDNG